MSLALPLDPCETIIPTEKETQQAKKSSRILAAYAQSTAHPTIQLLKKGNILEKLTLPASALRLLVDMLTQMANGNAVTLISMHADHAELTTQEAADFLNVSRPYLVKLLEKKQLPYRKVGTRRRVLVKDVLQYKSSIDTERLKTLHELTIQAQQLHMGY